MNPDNMKNPDSDIPAIFYGRAGVPQELGDYLRGVAENVSGKRYQPTEFAEAGLDEIARQQSAEIKKHHAESQRRAGGSTSRENWPRMPVSVSAWAYLLHAYCYKYKRPATKDLMELTYHVMNCPAPVPDIYEKLNLPTGIKKFDTFLEAARLDGEAEANGNPLPVTKLAKLANVERATIRKWRGDPAYQQRRKSFSGTDPEVIAMWKRVLAKQGVLKSE